jgi:hypothetical protein
LDDAAFAAVTEHLERAGFAADRYEVLHGERDLNRLDTTGEAHGQIGRVFRVLQDAVTDEGEHARRYAEYLSAGHYLVRVPVGDDEAAKQRAAEAMRRDADFLVYYAANYIEDLGANS